MFSYYGGKSKIIHKYQEAKYPLIIEPFAGSARYSLRFYNKDCWINDSYKVICDVWNWMIRAELDDINKIPFLARGDDLRSLEMDKDLRSLLGFAVNRGVPYPRHIYTKWPAESDEIGRLKNKLIHYCGKLKHWKVTNLKYLELPDIEATWYIDPPYQFGGDLYIENKINYQELADWCKSRKGQVIVCENSKADWLPFKFLTEMSGSKHRTTEVIWTNE